jgi:hypothetical protein
MSNAQNNNLKKYETSDKSHEEMLKKYVEYYYLWDLWVQRRSVRTYYAAQRVSKELYQLMRNHNRVLSKDFYKYNRPNLKKNKNKPDN